MVDDPDPDGHPSAIRTYIECLRRTPPEATHRLVLQDDVVLCRDFERRAEAAVVARPDMLIALFVPGLGLPGRWVREAAARGDSWQQLPTSVNWTPMVALSWPAALAAEFVDFAEEYVAHRAARRRTTTGDDPVSGAFVRARKLAVWATVPCLVEHPDIGVSLVKRRNYRGTNPARKAAVYRAD